MPVLRAVATDGHRLARVEMPLPDGAAGMPGRHRAAQDGRRAAQADRRSRRAPIEVALSDTKIRFAFDGHGADLEADRRHLPGLRAGHSGRQRQDHGGRLQELRRGGRPGLDHLDREEPRGQAGSSIPAADPLGDQPRERQPRSRRSRSTTAARRIEIGFNSRYLLDIAQQIEGDGGASSPWPTPASPTIVRDVADASALYVLMPMRV